MIFVVGTGISCTLWHIFTQNKKKKRGEGKEEGKEEAIRFYVQRNYYSDK